MLLFTASQYIFYAGRFPDSNRYAFPGMLFLPLSLLGANQSIQAVFPVEKYPGLQRSGITLQATVLFYVLFCNGFFPAKEMISDRIQKTTAFTNFIKQTSITLNSYPEADVVLKSSQPYDYETILSIERFLRAKGVKNRIFLDYEHGKEPESELGTLLVDISENGTTKQVWFNDWEYLRGQGKKRIQPLRNFNSSGPCFEIYLSGDESDYPNCIQLEK